MLVRRFRNIRKDERGVTLIEVVFAVALFFVIGSTFVFAMSAVSKVSGDSNERSKASMSQSGISNSFRTDLGSAKAVKLVNSNNLLIAKTDGSCVSWAFSTPTGESSPALGRSSANGTPAPTVSTFLQRGVQTGSFTVAGGTVGLNFNYNFGDRSVSFSDSAPLKIAGSDGGVCWS